MKIVIVFGAFSFGGTERVACELANIFISMQYDVTIITMKKKELCYQLSEKVHIYNGLSGNSKLRQISILKKTIETIEPDIVLSFMTQINIACILALANSKVPLIISERNSPRDMPRSKTQRFLRRMLYPFAEGFVFQTNEAKQYFSSSIQKRSRVIGNPLFLEADIVPFNKRKNEIVSVGRLMPQKDHITLLKAFEEFQKYNKDYKLKIYGDGPERKNLEEYIHIHNLGKHVELYGNSKNVQKDISYSKLFVLSSRFEGMPNALMEAMGLGLVSISTDCPCGGPRELIENTINGFLYDVGDYKGLASILKHVTSEEDLSLIGEKATISMQRYSIDVIAKEWDSYIINIKGKYKYG